MNNVEYQNYTAPTTVLFHFHFNVFITTACLNDQKVWNRIYHFQVFVCEEVILLFFTSSVLYTSSVYFLLAKWFSSTIETHLNFHKTPFLKKSKWKIWAFGKFRQVPFTLVTSIKLLCKCEAITVCFQIFSHICAKWSCIIREKHTNNRTLENR